MKEIKKEWKQMLARKDKRVDMFNEKSRMDQDRYNHKKRLTKLMQKQVQGQL